MEESFNSRDKDLQHYLQILYKRKWVILVTFTLVVTAAHFITKEQQRVYRATSTVLIDRNPPQVLSGVRDVVQVGGHSYWAVQDYLVTQFEIIKSVEVTRKVVLQLKDLGLYDRLAERFTAFARDPDTDIALMLSSMLEVDPLENSMLVRLHVEDSDPEAAQAIVNAYATSYVAFNLEYKRQVLLDAHKDLAELVRRLEAESDEAELKVYEYEKKHNIGTFENRGDAIKVNLGEMTRSLATLQIRQLELKAKLKQLRPFEKAKDIFSIGEEELLADGLLTDMKKDYLTVKQEMMDLSQTYGKKHPRLTALKPKLEYLESSIRKQIQSRVGAVRRQLAQVEDAISGTQERLKTLHEQETVMAGILLEYEPLVAKRKGANTFYDQVRNRLTETSMSAQVETNNVRVQDLALRPMKPVRPRPQLNLLIGGLAGLLLGLLFAFLLDLLDNTIKDREELEGDFGLTFIGVLPSIRVQEFKELETGSSSKELISFLRPRSNISELSRNIRTNLMFLRPEKPLHSIVVTSAHPQEGKTTIAVNIAITMAVSGKKTLLIDTDLRRARVHKIFAMKRKHGLSEWLVRDKPLDRYVRQTPVENLFLLAAGSVPPNPSELLHSKKFAELLVTIREEYDFVIFDSPPITAVTDAVIIGKMIDGIVLVARAKKTTRSSMRFVLRELRNIDVNIIGAILNDLDLRRRRYYYYQGKYYHYKSNYYAPDESESEEDKAAEDAAAEGGEKEDKHDARSA